MFSFFGFLTFDDCLGSFGYVDIELHLVEFSRIPLQIMFFLETIRSWFWPYET